MSPFVRRGGRHLTRILMTSSSDRVTVTSRGAELGAAVSNANIVHIEQPRPVASTANKHWGDD